MCESKSEPAILCMNIVSVSESSLRWIRYADLLFLKWDVEERPAQ